MKIAAGIGALSLSFLMATGALAQQHPLVVQGSVDELRQLMRERFPEGSRIFTTTGADADADDVSYSMELQTANVDQVSTCVAGGVGVEQLRIIVLSDHDLEESDYGPLHYTQQAANIFSGYMEENRLSDVPMDDKPDEMTDEAWYHAYKMGNVAALIADETGITATVFTVQIPIEHVPGVDLQCNIPMSDDMMDGFNMPSPDEPDDNGPVIEPPDMGDGNDGVITPNP